MALAREETNWVPHFSRLLEKWGLLHFQSRPFGSVAENRICRFPSSLQARFSNLSKWAPIFLSVHRGRVAHLPEEYNCFFAYPRRRGCPSSRGFRDVGSRDDSGAGVDKDCVGTTGRRATYTPDSSPASGVGVTAVRFEFAVCLPDVRPSGPVLWQRRSAFHHVQLLPSPASAG